VNEFILKKCYVLLPILVYFKISLTFNCYLGNSLLFPVRSFTFIYLIMSIYLEILRFFYISDWFTNCTGIANYPFLTQPMSPRTCENMGNKKSHLAVKVSAFIRMIGIMLTTYYWNPFGVKPSNPI